MSNEIELILKNMWAAPQHSQEFKRLTARIWAMLSPHARVTLNALVREGPLFDGDVPSKVGRNMLLDFRLATKVVVAGETGYQAATYDGFYVWKAGGNQKC